MTFKLLKPTTITDSMLVSSSIAENDYPAWNAGSTYSIGDKVIRTTTHKIYEALQSGVDATPPEDATTGVTPRWLDLGYVNRWRMFDEIVNSTSDGTSPVTVVLTPGIISGLAVIGLLNATSVRVQLHDGLTSVYDQTVYLDNTPIFDWYDYFFEPYDTGDSALFSEIPPYGAGELTVTVFGPTSVQIGGIVVGKEYSLGSTEYGAGVGIIDYSRKETDVFGRTQIVKRAYSKRMNIKLFMDSVTLRRNYTLLADVRSTPCVWIGISEDTVSFAPLVIYGFYRDFNIDISYPTTHYCNLEIEGLI